MKFAIIFYTIILLNISSLLIAQNEVTFENQDWTADQSLDSTFIVNEFSFISNKNFYTNYGFDFDVYGISIYFVFQNPEADSFTIKKTDNSVFNFYTVAAYQVSENSSDTLVIEGWNKNQRKYYSFFNKITEWKTLNLNYKNIDRVVFKIKGTGESDLSDFNFDNFLFGTSVLSTENIEQLDYSLEQNFPNPFNPVTTISYRLKNGSKVKLIVYDILGNEVASLVNDYKDAGKYEVNFRADELSSGIYFYKLITNEFVSTKKMMLLK